MHVVYFIDNLGSGGAQRQAVVLARRLHTEHGVRMTVGVYHDIDFYGARLREAGIPVHLVERGRVPGPGFAWRLRRWIREQSPDLVHAFMLRPAFWSLLAVRSLPRRSRPLLVAAERCELEGRSRSEALLQRLAYSGSDLVTANAGVALEQIHQRLGVPRERLCYLPNGIDLEAWDREAAAPCPLPVDRTRFCLALVGGFRPQKNHEMLLEALERVDPARRSRWQVWFIGGSNDGAEYPARVRAEIARRGLSSVVTVAGATQAIGAVMGHLDALVLPSHFEGFPNVLLEAMASRLPAVATPAGDVPSLMQDGRTGFLVPLGDAAALASALERLEDMGPEGRRALGERARAVVEQRYRIEAVAEQHLALYRRLLAARTD